MLLMVGAARPVRPAPRELGTTLRSSRRRRSAVPGPRCRRHGDPAARASYEAGVRLDARARHDRRSSCSPWRAGGRRPRARRARGELHSELAEAVAEAVDESLDDLRAEPDPRRAVIAAYARLERVLAAHGLPRKPAEAPLEYLGRMLAGALRLRQAAAPLTDLFERAKFSQHAVGPEMKEQAIDALETVRDDLLAARALARNRSSGGARGAARAAAAECRRRCSSAASRLPDARAARRAGRPARPRRARAPGLRAPARGLRARHALARLHGSLPAPAAVARGRCR